MYIYMLFINMYYIFWHVTFDILITYYLIMFKITTQKYVASHLNLYEVHKCISELYY